MTSLTTSRCTTIGEILQEIFHRTGITSHSGYQVSKTEPVMKLKIEIEMIYNICLDLHGDGRVHIPEPSVDLEFRSGMGFELTFRLLKGNEQRPPTWPANLLQDLARYVFNTGNRFCVGDNIPWLKKSLDNSNSKILHMLIAEDAQLRRTETPFGWVDFCQIVGVTSEELDQASRWNGKGVLNLLKNNPT